MGCKWSLVTRKVFQPPKFTEVLTSHLAPSRLCHHRSLALPLPSARGSPHGQSSPVTAHAPLPPSSANSSSGRRRPASASARRPLGLFGAVAALSLSYSALAGLPSASEGLVAERRATDLRGGRRDGWARLLGARTCVSGRVPPPASRSRPSSAAHPASPARRYPAASVAAPASPRHLGPRGQP